MQEAQLDEGSDAKDGHIVAGELPRSTSKQVGHPLQDGHIVAAELPRSTSKQVGHPLQEQQHLLSCVGLLDASTFSRLQTPLPREQDLPGEFFRAPSYGDQVISVSHAWRNQAHPDPTCRKVTFLCELLSRLKHPKTLLFLDFISIPQRPFKRGQAARKCEEVTRFRTALERLPEMYLYSDRIIHLPWDDAPVPEEGMEFVATVQDLEDATFADMGGNVQVSGFVSQPNSPTSSCSMRTWGRCSGSSRGEARSVAVRRRNSYGSRNEVSGFVNQPDSLTPASSLRTSRRSSSSASEVHLFDQVVAVDGQPVGSAEQLAGLIRSSAGGMEVRLLRYPFGFSCQTPADDRGWIFLERFITMVKCAMFDKELAKDVVITPSNAIFQEIMEGADRLREAARRDQRSGAGSRRGELKRVLADFELQLQSKKFSAASTDKRELDSGGLSEDDKVAVGSLMHRFVEHLSDHWEAEAAKQRSFAAMLSSAIQATQEILLDWESFSKEYSVRLDKPASARGFSLLGLLLVLPTCVAASVLLWPYASPEEDWQSQIALWAFGFPLQHALCSASFPAIMLRTTGVRSSPKLLLGFVVWTLLAVVLTLGVAFAVGHGLRSFPVPGLTVLGEPLAFLLLPLLWWCIPPSQRASAAFRWRLLYSMLSLCFMHGIFGMGFPLLNAAIPFLPLGWQAVLVSGYLFAKLLFEAVAGKLSKRLGADVMPVYVFTATMCYQINLCVAFANASSWLIVVQQICFDVLENLYHLWSIRRHHASGGEAPRRQQYIVASLVVREFGELLAPIQFLIVYNLMQRFRPENSELLCEREQEGVNRTQLYVLVDIAVQLVISALTYVVVLLHGASPLALLQGLVKTRLEILLVFASAIPIYFLSLQHSHWGMDLSFRWLWLMDADAEWVCGLTWVSTV